MAPQPDCCRTPTPRNPARCPSCGHKGKPVSALTIESLVLPERLSSLSGSDGFRFCAEVGCELAYFHPESREQVTSAQVRIPIGQKQTTPDRTLCYCFDHTALELQTQLARTGTTTLPDEIAALCKRGLDRCEETNPQGSCCLGNIRQFLRSAGQTEPGQATPAAPPRPDVTPTRRNVGLWATTGAVLSALLSSACCWLPLLLISFGASAAGVSGFFESYRGEFLALTALLLGSGFYLVYFRAPRCEPGEACALPNSRLVRFNRISLWVASVFVLAFAFFPTYVGTLMGTPGGSASVEVSSAERRQFRIEGMTCAACAGTLQGELSGLPGVLGAEVSYESGIATLFLDPGGPPPSDERIEETIEAAGYRGAPTASR